jgi:hypothetical protein
VKNALIGKKKRVFAKNSISSFVCDQIINRTYIFSSYVYIIVCNFSLPQFTLRGSWDSQVDTCIIKIKKI